VVPWRLAAARQVERIRVIPQSAEADAVPGAQRVDVVGLGLGEAVDVDVRDAGELPFGLADRPAHDFEAVEALAGGEFEELG